MTRKPCRRWSKPHRTYASYIHTWCWPCIPSFVAIHEKLCSKGANVSPAQEANMKCDKQTNRLTPQKSVNLLMREWHINFGRNLLHKVCKKTNNNNKPTIWWFMYKPSSNFIQAWTQCKGLSFRGPSSFHVLHLISTQHTTRHLKNKNNFPCGRNTKQLLTHHYQCTVPSTPT